MTCVFQLGTDRSNCRAIPVTPDSLLASAEMRRNWKVLEPTPCSERIRAAFDLDAATLQKAVDLNVGRQA